MEPLPNRGMKEVKDKVTEWAADMLTAVETNLLPKLSR